MRVAAGQFAVTPVWRTNAQTCVAMMQQAEREGAALLVLPEALLARDDNDPDLSSRWMAHFCSRCWPRAGVTA